MLKTKKGFTLIELLIVIGIIGILSGILFVVLDPAAQRKKAEQAVIRSNVEKLCLSKAACLSADSTGAEGSCNTKALLGGSEPNGTPAGSSYDVTVVDKVSGKDATTATCTFTCTVSTGVIVATGSGCVLK